MINSTSGEDEEFTPKRISIPVLPKDDREEQGMFSPLFLSFVLFFFLFFLFFFVIILLLIMMHSASPLPIHE